jgi:acyl carrier protein
MTTQLTKKEIGNKLIELISEYTCLKKITLKTKISELEMDSLESYELIYDIEDILGIRLPDSYLEEIRDNQEAYNIKKLRDYIWKEN